MVTELPARRDGLSTAASAPAALPNAVTPSDPASEAGALPATPASPVVTGAKRATDGYRFWIVPHTHWDREWYLPFEQFRMRLVRTVDEILDVLEADPSFTKFVLDGQAVVLEDFLEIEPGQGPRLRRLIEQGRIAIGPSYILPDEYLVGGESLVRNLLMGRKVCRSHGGEPMPVGYMPDTFGHVEQLPQILRGFGLDSFVFWRGLGDEADELGALFRWRGPDGSEVLAVRQLGSYGSSDELGRWGRNGTSFKAEPARWPEVAAMRMDRFLELFGPALERSGTRDALLCNGSDHKPIQRDVPALLEAARGAHPGATFRIATYDEYVSALRASLDDAAFAALAIREGELCGGKDAAVLRGVNSARLELKQANEATERALFVAETLASLAELRAMSGGVTADAEPGAASPAVPYHYPLAALRHAWRELLRNQPHDSISGCSTDDVHLDMAQRYRSAQQIAARVRLEALTALTGRTALWSSPPPGPGAAHSIVNVLPWPRTAVVTLPLSGELAAARRIVATMDGGMPVPAQIGSTQPRRALVAATVPGFGACTVSLAAAPTESGPAGGARVVDERTIENERYRVHVLPNGSLEVTDLRHGRTWTGLHRFEDVADRGDEYNFCPVAGDVAWTSDGGNATVRIAAAGPAVAEMRIDLVARLPRGLQSGRAARSRATGACRIRTLVRLAAGVERIDFTTTIDNRVQDHRLRVVFAAPESRGEVRAEGHFGLVRRPALPLWSGEGWQEPPAPTHHTSGAVAAGRLTLYARGLPEYQAVLRSGGGVDLALTLVRSVGWLSRDDLSTRPGHAGPGLETPGAQCRGQRHVEYAIDFDGTRTDADVLRAAQAYRVELVAGPPGADTAGLLSIDGEGFGFSGLKGAEDGNGVVARLYAGADAPAIARLRPAAGMVAERCRLDEEPLDELGAAELGAPDRLRPSQIVTYRLRPLP